MNALASRKQLLIAESELNRAHLLHEMETLSGEVHALANQAKSIGSIASAAASLVAGLTIRRRHSPSSPGEKPTWGQSIAKVAGWITTFWSVFRARPESKPDDSE